MAGKRLYLTVPRRDYELIRRLAVLTGQLPAVWARTQVLLALYAVLRNDEELQDYDAELAYADRQEVLRGGRS